MISSEDIKAFKWEMRQFRQQGGILRTAQAVRAGIHPRDLYAMTRKGIIEALGRGLYRLKGLPPLSQPDLVTVSLKIPQGVFCLISALSLHNITTQVPHEVWVALKQGADQPRLSQPPLRVIRLSGAAFSEGVESRLVDGVSLRVYSAEKTVADCFKFRNRLGLDVAIEALRLCRQRRRSKPDVLMHFARLNRVERIMKPYLEALL
jgi:predicted transcriptional regulator of viral defense system